MPYRDGPNFMAYQVMVPGSFSASGCADFRNFSTSCSLPGLASSCAQMASFPMVIFLLGMRCTTQAFGTVYPSGNKTMVVQCKLSSRLTFGQCHQANRYNPTMSLVDQIQKDITAAMKAREEQRLSTLRMVKTALKTARSRKWRPSRTKNPRP